MDAPGNAPPLRRVGGGRRAAGVGLVVIGLPAGTAALAAVGDGLALSSVLLLYVSAVVVIAAVGGLVPGALAAVSSFCLATWFFIPPFHTLSVHGRDAVVDLVVFALVAGTVSATVELAARDRAASQHQLAAHEVRARELAAVDRVRSALLAAVGHDLRTPLATVKAAVGSLRQPDVVWSPAEVAELLATIEGSTDRLTSLVTNLLDMTRLRSDALTVRLRPVALDEVVSRALLHQPTGDVETEVPDDLPPVWADPGLLERVLENLVENAVRYSAPGAPVTVGAALRAGASERDVRGGSLAGDARGAGPRVAVQVVDRGPGIPVERRSEVFRAFQRLDDRDSGSHVGLGLAIAQGFTEAMGGTLTPSTTPGGGLTMTVELPAAAR